MMSQSQKTESLFYYFQLDDHIPENHLLRLIDRYVDFSFVRERLKESYSQVGRPSIDPQVLLRLLLSVISMGSPANAQGPVSTSSLGQHVIFPLLRLVPRAAKAACRWLP